MQVVIEAPRHLVTRSCWAITVVTPCDRHDSAFNLGLVDHVPCLCTGHGRLLYLQPVSGHGG